MAENTRGFKRDRDQGAGQDEALSLRGQQSQRHADPGQDERELANLSEARRHGERSAEWVSQEKHERSRNQGVADDDDRHDDEHLQRLVEYDGRVEQHADRYEEQHGERVAQRERFPVRRDG